MSNTLRIVFAVITAVIALAMLGLAIFALTIPSIGFFVSCLALAAVFGFFVYHDCQFFFGGKSDGTS